MAVPSRASPSTVKGIQLSQRAAPIRLTISDGVTSDASISMTR